MHMKIINNNRTEKIKKHDSQNLKLKGKDLTCCQRLSIRLTQIFNPVIDFTPYPNDHPVDDFVDRYWFINCDRQKSSWEVNNNVFDFFNNIVIKGYKNNQTLLNIEKLKEHNLIVLAL